MSNSVPGMALAASAITLGEQDDLTRVAFSEDDLAERFSACHPYTRYTHVWRQWHEWDERRWVEDSTLAIFDKARAVAKASAAECEKNGGKGASRIVTASMIAAVERLAKTDRRHAAIAEQWDADLWILNTPTGTVDLRTGEIRRHRKEDYCTKITSVGPAGQCPLWLQFLGRVCGGDKELEAYLQRAMGYSLTGAVIEHIFFFAYGPGGNGKSTFVKTILGILGDYGTATPMETFVVTSGDRHPTEIASLVGKRLAVAVETESGQRFAEAKLKNITGGDRISARRMRQDFFEFDPQFKLILVGNNRPSLRSVDEAMRRRIRMIPFNVTIPEGERDPHLSEKLKTEWPGILAWAISGCLDWQSQGLKAPESVMVATDDYMSSQDAMGAWLEERCLISPRYSSSTSAMFEDWKSWAEQNNEYTGSQRWFTEKMKSRDAIQHQHTRDGRRFTGVALRKDVPHESDSACEA